MEWGGGGYIFAPKLHVFFVSEHSASFVSELSAPCFCKEKVFFCRKGFGLPPSSTLPCDLLTGNSEAACTYNSGGGAPLLGPRVQQLPAVQGRPAVPRQKSVFSRADNFRRFKHDLLNITKLLL